MNTKNIKRLKRKHSIRKTIVGTSTKPRLSVFRSNKHIFAQIIDDENSKTLLGMSDAKLKAGENKKLSTASELGKQFGSKAKSMKITELVFDRNGYMFHGRVKAFAEAVRECGLKF